MKKVIIFGAGGMAGHLISEYFQSLNKYQIFKTYRKPSRDANSTAVDIENLIDLNRFLYSENAKADVIINCIGLLVNESLEQPHKAIIINSWFPKYLEMFYKNANTKIIHISTDCVFDGKQSGFYNETDIPTEIHPYGRSKSLGEINNPKDLTFRMSICGPEAKNGTSIFHWFMKQKKSITGYTNVMWNGITTLELAKAMDAAIDQNLGGLYHLVNNTKISKYDLLLLFKKYFEKEIDIVPGLGAASDKCLFNNRTDFNFTVNQYETMIAELKTWVDGSKKYPHYSKSPNS